MIGKIMNFRRSLQFARRQKQLIKVHATAVRCITIIWSKLKYRES